MTPIEIAAVVLLGLLVVGWIVLYVSIAQMDERVKGLEAFRKDYHEGHDVRQLMDQGVRISRLELQMKGLAPRTSLRQRIEDQADWIYNETGRHPTSLLISVDAEKALRREVYWTMPMFQPMPSAPITEMWTDHGKLTVTVLHATPAKFEFEVHP